MQLGGAHYASGWTGLILAASVCGKITLYGMQISEEQGVPYHYHNRQRRLSIHTHKNTCFRSTYQSASPRFYTRAVYTGSERLYQKLDKKPDE